MSRRPVARLCIRGRQPIGVVLTLLAHAAAAQTGPLINQNLYFTRAAGAQQGHYLEADGGFVFTDNVTRTPNGPSDTLALLGLVGDLARTGTRLDYSLVSDIFFVDYLHSTFQSQPFGFLNGSAEAWITPGFFSWTARETFAQTLLNPLAPVTPENLESFNYLSTGPRFTLRPTLRTTVVVDGTYSYLNSSSKSPSYVNIDNHRYAGLITLKQAFTNTSSGYVTAGGQKVEFSDQVTNTNFTQRELLVGYKLSDARTELDLAAGYSWLHVGTETPSGSIWHFLLVRQISPAQRIALRASQVITDAPNLFRLSLDQPVTSTIPYSFTTSQPFTDRQFGADWQLQGARTALQLGFLSVRDRYELTPSSDRDLKIGSAFVTRQISPTLKFVIAGEFLRQQYTTGGSSDTVYVSTYLRWQLGRRLALRFLYGYSDQTPKTPNGYTENQVGVIASYAFVPGGQVSGEPGTEPASPLETLPEPNSAPAQ
jgi:hypothetical protein